MNKRVLSLFVFSLVAFSVLSSNFASASYYFPSVRGVSESVITTYIDVFEPVLQALFGGYGGWTGYLLFERFLIFILLVSVIYIVLGRIELFADKKGIKWIVSIVVPLIGMRYIDYASLSAIINQYQVLSIALTAVLPFIIFFYFVHGVGAGSHILRQICWIFFIAVYIGLWSTTQSELSSQIYFWTLAAAVISMVFDKRIDGYFRARRIARQGTFMVHREIGDINQEIDRIRNQIRLNQFPDPRVGQKMIEDLQRQVKYLQRQL